MTIQELADSLSGTCQNINDVIERELTTEECMELDNLVSLCSVCGWWYESCEMTERDGEFECGDCGESEDV